MAKHQGLTLAFINLDEAFDKVPCTKLMQVVLCKCCLDPSYVEVVH